MSVDFSAEINTFLNAELGEEVRGALVSIAQALQTAINAQLYTVTSDLTNPDVKAAAQAKIVGDALAKTLSEKSAVSNNADLDSVVAIGMYALYANYTYTHSPLAAGQAGLLLVYKCGSLLYQYIVAIGGNDNGNCYIRGYYNNAWHAFNTISADKKTFSDTYNPVGNGIAQDANTVIITDFESGYYSNENGTLQNSSSYCRTKSLFLVDEKYGIELLGSTDASSHPVYVVYYDKDFVFIGYQRIFNVDGHVPKTVPVNAVYAGVSYTLNGGSTPTSISFKFVDGANVLNAFPVASENDGVFGRMSRVINNDGTLTNTTNDFKCLFIPNPNCKYVFSNGSFENQCFCKNYSGEITTPSTYEQIGDYGRLYTIPANTAIIGLNLYANGGSYVSLLYDDEERALCMKFVRALPVSRINGKRIAAIGDSITWLDGRSGHGDQNHMVGWQSYLRFCGAYVKTYGYSGVPYAKTTDADGIAETVETIDLTSFDIAILFGGSNDERLSVPIGAANSDYNAPNTDTETFVGAIGSLIEYCREENPNMEIFICTILPSTDNSRSFTIMQQYNAAIKACGEFWNVPIIDTCQLINARPKGANFAEYFYDSTHPNSKGMNRIGRAIAAYVNNYLSLLEG